MACCCSVRCIFLTVCMFQLVATIQRQILDFLGFMWTPILMNFIQIIFSIFGIFGTYQYKIKYVSMYAVWSCLWLGWNIFVICVYFEAGILTRDTEVLNMGTGSRSWWLANGAGCSAIYNSTHDDPTLFPSPDRVDGCAIEYFYIEALQAALHCFLAILGIVSAAGAIYVFSRDEDSCSHKHMGSLPYSIEYHNDTATNSAACPQRPMTPRKVKQRSTRSKRGSRRRYYQNPVTKLINAPHQNNHGSEFPYPGRTNPAFAISEPHLEASAASRPNSMMLHNMRPSPLYMNERDTVI